MIETIFLGLREYYYYCYKNSVGLVAHPTKYVGRNFILLSLFQDWFWTGLGPIDHFYEMLLLLEKGLATFNISIHNAYVMIQNN